MTSPVTRRTVIGSWMRRAISLDCASIATFRANSDAVSGATRRADREHTGIRRRIFGDVLGEAVAAGTAAVAGRGDDKHVALDGVLHRGVEDRGLERGAERDVHDPRTVVGRPHDRLRDVARL